MPSAWATAYSFAECEG